MTNDRKAVARELLVIEQCDREVAADVVEQWPSLINGKALARRIREGGHDDWQIVRAFAQHRTTALSPPLKAEIEGVVERVNAGLRLANLLSGDVPITTQARDTLNHALDASSQLEAHLQRQQADIARLEAECEQIARTLIDQDAEPWMTGTDADRLHYWRDKAINAAAAIRALRSPGTEGGEK